MAMNQFSQKLTTEKLPAMKNQIESEPLYTSEAERNLHASAIRGLSEEYAVQIDIIKDVYEGILRGLKSRARVKKYLSIIVVRTIRNLISNPSLESVSIVEIKHAEKYRKNLLAALYDD